MLLLSWWLLQCYCDMIICRNFRVRKSSTLAEFMEMLSGSLVSYDVDWFWTLLYLLVSCVIVVNSAMWLKFMAVITLTNIDQFERGLHCFNHVWISCTLIVYTLSDRCGEHLAWCDAVYCHLAIGNVTWYFMMMQKTAASKLVDDKTFLCSHYSRQSDLCLVLDVMLYWLKMFVE